VTIEKGQPWGAPGSLPAGARIARSDEGLRALVEEARRTRTTLPPVGLLGGDLHRTLGGTGNDEARLRSPDAVTFPIDVGEVLIDGVLHRFVAHLIARNRMWTRAWVACNAQWYERLNLAPRAHPNDGLLDVLDARLSVGELLKVSRRARLGTHLPHPAIRQERTAATQVTFDRPRDVILDGTWVARARQLSVRVAPDAITVVI
jgi:hypothetical protein